MSSSLPRKRSFKPNIPFDDIPTISTKRRRSRSLSSTPTSPPYNSGFSPSPRLPPSGYDLDRLNYHINLQDFGYSLQKAANAIFPGDQLSRYSKVDVILLSWEEEDPNLPVSLEIQELKAILGELYGYNVEEWLIPGEDCHNRLQARILEFLGESDPRYLKIVYYAGHGKLTNHGQPAWTSRRNSRKDRCPTIKWSGIQNTLEESRSDVLILLDCCSSGVCTTDEGNGVTELIAACAYNAIANGVGPFSFTHALNTKLRQMSRLPHFTVGQLYNAIFTEIQGLKLDDEKHRKVPVHLALSQNPEWPRSIRLANYSKGNRREGTDELAAFPPSTGASSAQPLEAPSGSETPRQSSHPPDSASPFSKQTSPSSSETSLSQLPEYPRLLFSVRLGEDVKPNELSEDLFADWLRSIPVSASLIRVEAGFASDSTLLILSMPPSVLAYLPLDPAITLLGTVRSKNMMVRPQTRPTWTTEEMGLCSEVRNSKEMSAPPPAPSSPYHKWSAAELLEDQEATMWRPTESHSLPAPDILSPGSAFENSEATNYQSTEFSDVENSLFGIDFSAGTNQMDEHRSIPTKSGAFGPTPTVSTATLTEIAGFGHTPANSTGRTNQPALHNQIGNLFQPNEDNPHTYYRPREPQGALMSPDHSSAASTTGAHTDDDEVTSVYSLPVDIQNEVVLAKMKPAHLSLNVPMFGGDIPEDIGYEIYKLGTLVHALNPKHPEIDVGR